MFNRSALTGVRSESHHRWIRVSAACLAIGIVLAGPSPASAADRPDDVETLASTEGEIPTDMRDVETPLIEPTRSAYFDGGDIEKNRVVTDVVMSEAKAAKASILVQGMAGEGALDTAINFENGKPKATEKPSDKRQVALAHLYDGLADLPPGSSVKGSNLAISELALPDGNVSFIVVPEGVVPLGSKWEVFVSPDGDESKEVEQLGLLAEQVDEMDNAVLPERRGFASSVRLNSGFYGWKSGSKGRVKLTWVKDKVVDSNPNADWFVYTTYVDADPFSRSWDYDYFVYDIDLLNGVSSADRMHVLNDSVTRDPGTVTSGCSSVDLGAGGGVSIGTSFTTCNRSYEKGDTFGGMHMEYRARCGIGDGYMSLRNKSVSVGYSIEVKTTPRSRLFWWDYGDAAFGFPSYNCLTLDLDEVVL